MFKHVFFKGIIRSECDKDEDLIIPQCKTCKTVGSTIMRISYPQYQSKTVKKTLQSKLLQLKNRDLKNFLLSMIYKLIVMYFSSKLFTALNHGFSHFKK